MCRWNWLQMMQHPRVRCADRRARWHASLSQAAQNPTGYLCSARTSQCYNVGVCRRRCKRELAVVCCHCERQGLIEPFRHPLAVGTSHTARRAGELDLQGRKVSSIVHAGTLITTAALTLSPGSSLLFQSTCSTTWQRTACTTATCG